MFGASISNTQTHHTRLDAMGLRISVIQGSGQRQTAPGSWADEWTFLGDRSWLRQAQTSSLLSERTFVGETPPRAGHRRRAARAAAGAASRCSPPPVGHSRSRSFRACPRATPGLVNTSSILCLAYGRQDIGTLELIAIRGTGG
jgi:hypothetical protein